MNRLFVAPFAKTGSPGCGARRDLGHLLHLRTHGKTLNRPSCTPAKKESPAFERAGLGTGYEPPTGLVHQGCAVCGAASSRAAGDAGDAADGEAVGSAADSAAAAGAVQPPPSAL